MQICVTIRYFEPLSKIMLTKNEIKYLKSLHQKKEREVAQCFLCEGEKIVSEALESGWKVKKVFITHKVVETSIFKTDFEAISEKEMEQISSLATPPGVMALVEYPPLIRPNFDELNSELFLILDSINDPGNLGTIIRLADWYNIKYIFCSENTVDRFNAKVVQASMGSIFRTTIFYTDLIAFLNDCQQEQIPLFAAVMNGNLAQKGFMNKGGLIMGSESHGISNSLLNTKITKVTIPKFGKAESLNVGVATGILLSMLR